MYNHKRFIRVLIALLLILKIQCCGSLLAAGLPLNWDKSACLIESFGSGSSFRATGFFVKNDKDPLMEDSMFLVTNRHVVSTNKQMVSGYDSIRITYYNEDTILATKTVAFLSNKQNLSVKIHYDTIVDVAVINLDFKDMLSFIKVSDFMGFQELTTGYIGYDVFFFGYPRAIKELKNLNGPLLRKGIISYLVRDTIMQAKGLLPYESFLIDGFSWPGNSGSPVVLPRKWTEQGLASQPRPYHLIGITYGSIEYIKPVCPEDSVHQKCPKDSVNTGLAQAFPSDRIKEVINLFKKKP